MNRRLLPLALLFTVSCYGSQQSACGTGPTPLPPAPTPTPTPVPTPVVIVVPAPTPSSSECDATSIEIKSEAGNELKVGALVRLDATPFHGSTKIADSCNAGVKVLWLTGPDTVCQLEGDVRGFNPMLRAVGVGKCNLNATIGNIGSGLLILNVTK